MTKADLGSTVQVTGPNGTLTRTFHPDIQVQMQDGQIEVSRPTDQRQHKALHGLTRALINNMVVGVSDGFQKKLQLVGVGYRAAGKGKVLNLSLGFSHPVDYPVPEGITIETPSQTEIVVSGCSKQQVGQVAAEIRSFRPPEPYKGKGVRYADERIIRKEAKKK